MSTALHTDGRNLETESSPRASGEAERPFDAFGVMIDGYNLALEAGTGIATYAKNLSLACKSLGCRTDIIYGQRASSGKDKILAEVSFFDPPKRKKANILTYANLAARLVSSVGGVRPYHVPVSGGVVLQGGGGRVSGFDNVWNVSDLFTFSHLYYALYRQFLTIKAPPGQNVMHWTYPLPLRLSGVPNIYTIHDLIPLRLPSTTLDNKKMYRRLISDVLKTADHIVTVSENSKHDIVNIFDYPKEKVTNTYQCADLSASNTSDSEDEVRDKVEGTFGLKYKHYFLFFGAIEPKKNVGRLIEAYLGSRVDETLVLVGKTAWKAKGELRFLQSMDLKYLEQSGNILRERSRVHRIDYVPSAVLVNLIRGAKAVVFPSLYEGFGLPVLEAMSLGTPVITSNAASLPEIAGDAAIMVDPYDVRSLAAAIKRVASDAALREEMSRKGREQAQLFTQERYRERLSGLYSRFLTP